MSASELERWIEAVEALDPESRAALDLSLRRGMGDRQVAGLVGVDPAVVAERRAAAMDEVTSRVGEGGPEAVDRVRSALLELAGERPDAGEQPDGRAPDRERGQPDRQPEQRESEERDGRGFLRDNALSIFFGLVFLGALLGQAIAGFKAFNEEEMQHGEEPISFFRYVTGSTFGRAVLENWQSEYLQFTLFIFATIWFVQRGSPESKEPGKEGRESAEDQRLGAHAGEGSPAAAGAGGFRTFVFSNSLVAFMMAIFIASWLVQSITGLTDFNSQQMDHRQETVSWLEYLREPNFWEETLQNWQSEFLAVGSMAVFSIYLRQRGSPESKPVGAAHTDTGVEG